MKNNQRFFTYLTTAFILMVFSGCTHRIVSEQYPVDQLMLPKFAGDKPITIINAQNEAEEILLGTNVGHKFMGNLQQFTDTAIETLKTELNKRGIPVTQNAEKELKITVTKVHFDSRLTGFWCDVDIKVETGDGYIGQVDGHDSNAWILYPAIYGALNHAVVALLNDDTVLTYLKH